MILPHGDTYVIIFCYHFSLHLSYGYVPFINFNLQLLIFFIEINIFLCGLLHVNILVHLDPLTDSCYGWPHSRIIIQTLLHQWPQHFSLSYHLIQVLLTSLNLQQCNFSSRLGIKLYLLTWSGPLLVKCVEDYSSK